MKPEIENKLYKIESLWNHFIWEYKFCSRKIKFNDDVKTNYLGSILGYFSDTLDLAFSTNKPVSNSDKFSFSMSLLQAIYIHQDFIEELLEIFKTGVNKGDLKEDESYSINRELRNELIGHPIRKFEGKLISSTLFSYQAKQDEIQYLRYHKDNNFAFECRTVGIVEIQKRHQKFLDKYLDIILSKLNSILNEFLLELDKVEAVKENNDFNTLLKLIELYFESIFTSDFAYDKSSLLRIYNRKNEHLRYQNFIDCFYVDLKDYLEDTRKYLVDIFERKSRIDSDLQSFNPLTIEFVTTTLRYTFL
ncbi:hypothetical protein V6R21_10060 [Limibacter armeniacum]|uniref:hypothetical protein n=1 Tax=Limibacter armeniacum TaxID=466084 RepID=UPI002FE5C72C